jgi:hypothetical protein
MSIRFNWRFLGSYSTALARYEQAFEVNPDTAMREIGVAWPRALPEGRGILLRVRHVGEGMADWSIIVLTPHLQPPNTHCRYLFTLHTPLPTLHCRHCRFKHQAAAGHTGLCLFQLRESNRVHVDSASLEDAPRALPSGCVNDSIAEAEGVGCPGFSGVNCDHVQQLLECASVHPVGIHEDGALCDE